MCANAYSQCTIRFAPNDTRPGRDYSDRSIIELRENDFADYSLRAIDIANNQKEIFKFKLTRRDMYEFGSFPENADKVRYNDGIYYLLLKGEGRESFHKTLRTCFERLESVQQASPDVISKQQLSDDVSRQLSEPKTIADGNAILDDIHKLNEYIRNGDEDKAVGRVQKLIKKGVRLQSDNSKGLSKDEKFQIQVKIDGMDSNINDQTVHVYVYPSTKVHELRALFEYTHKFPCGKQFFFVNGHLAHAESNMKELEVNDNSLFVLLVT